MHIDLILRIIIEPEVSMIIQQYDAAVKRGEINGRVGTFVIKQKIIAALLLNCLTIFCPLVTSWSNFLLHR